MRITFHSAKSAAANNVLLMRSTNIYLYKNSGQWYLSFDAFFLLYIGEGPTRELQLLNSFIGAKYSDLSNKSRYFAQPRPTIKYYTHRPLSTKTQRFLNSQMCLFTILPADYYTNLFSQ